MIGVVLVCVSCTKQKKRHEIIKTVENMTVTLSTRNEPLPKGSNILTLKIQDAAGKEVLADRVTMKCILEDLPTGKQQTREGRREVLLTADRKNDVYTAEAPFTTEGIWGIEVVAHMKEGIKPPILTTAFRVFVQ